MSGITRSRIWRRRWRRRCPGTGLSINRQAPPDKRSYRVDFSLFRQLAPGHQPVSTLTDSIERLKSGLESMGFADKDFRNSPLIRLKTLDRLISQGLLSPSLRWRHALPGAAGVKFIPTPLEGAYLIELEKRGDHRGFFARFFCEREFAEAGLETRFRPSQQLTDRGVRDLARHAFAIAARRRGQRSYAASAARCTMSSSICGPTARAI